MKANFLQGLFSAVACVGLTSGVLSAQQAEILNCTVPFEANSDQANANELRSCLDMMQGKSISFIQVMAGASPDGSAAHNQELTDRRAQSLRDNLASQFSDVRIEAMGVGENPTIGRQARIVAVVGTTTDTASAAASSAAPSSLNAGGTSAAATPGSTNPAGNEAIAGSNAGSNPGSDLSGIAGAGAGTTPGTTDTGDMSSATATAPDTTAESTTRSQAGFSGTDAATSRVDTGERRERAMRVALRVAQDRYQLNDEDYTAVGLETSFIRRKAFFDLMRSEFGLTGSAMTSTNLIDAYSAHALAGPAVEWKGFVLGGRVLGGAIYDSNTKWRGDAGGEFRLGYENDALSIFAGLGRTRNLNTRLGLDVGVLL